MSGDDASVSLRMAIVPEYTLFMRYGFRQVACAIEGMALGAWFA